MLSPSTVHSSAQYSLLLGSARRSLLSHAPITRGPAHGRARPLSSQARGTPSRHAQFYTDYAAGMIPVALLGSAVYIGLRTWQQHLAHEKFLEEGQSRVQELEAEVIALRQMQQSTVATQNQPTAWKRRWWLW